LQVDPENTELQALQTELEEFITLTETSIAELKPATPALSKDTRPKDNARKPVATEEAHPAPMNYSVNDNILARWVSGDNAFYPAKITSITGSSANPVYLVAFKSYSNVENLTAKDIRPISGTESRKRKADGTSGSSASSPAPPPGVISAAADINPTLATQARNDQVKSDGPARPAKAPRKVKANRELEEGKNKWKDFAAKTKGKGKFGKKDSMFRTGDGVNARGMYSSTICGLVVLTFS
jgi:survival-of-motor-neuron-related-splicing factor 30